MSDVRMKMISIPKILSLIKATRLGSGCLGLRVSAMMVERKIPQPGLWLIFLDGLSMSCMLMSIMGKYLHTFEPMEYPSRVHLCKLIQSPHVHKKHCACRAGKGWHQEHQCLSHRHPWPLPSDLSSQPQPIWIGEANGGKDSKKL